LHKKRSLTFQNEEFYRHEPIPDYDQQQIQKRQVFKFAYADPNDYIENYLKKRQIQEQQHALRIPRIQTPVSVLPKSKLKFSHVLS